MCNHKVLETDICIVTCTAVFNYSVSILKQFVCANLPHDENVRQNNMLYSKHLLFNMCESWKCNKERGKYVFAAQV